MSIVKNHDVAPGILLYLDLLKKCLTRYIFIDEQPTWGYSREHIANLRTYGGDWPMTAETMVGLKRLQNLQDCIIDVVRNNVPGDFVETGVWRGGACIFMRGVLRALGDLERVVWVADSFDGVPPPNPELYPLDDGSILHTARDLAISVDTVKKNFEKYEMLDHQVKFLKGWFKDTLPNAPIDKLAILRLDGDLYESTMDGFNALYPKLSVGGYVIVDDYCLDPCRQAVTDYRSRYQISDRIEVIDEMDSIYWRKETP